MGHIVSEVDDKLDGFGHDYLGVIDVHADDRPALSGAQETDRPE